MHWTRSGGTSAAPVPPPDPRPARPWPGAGRAWALAAAREQRRSDRISVALPGVRVFSARAEVICFTRIPPSGLRRGEHAQHLLILGPSASILMPSDHGGTIEPATVALASALTSRRAGWPAPRPPSPAPRPAAQGRPSAAPSAAGPARLPPAAARLLRTFFSRASSRPSTDGTSHLHEQRERTNRAPLSRTQPEFVPDQRKPSNHIRKAEAFSAFDSATHGEDPECEDR